MSARLHDWLAREGVMSPAALNAAVARQRIYGGGLDTAILERGALTEPALWARLAAATGLPVPEPALCNGAGVAAMPPALDAATTKPLRAVPVGYDGDIVLLLCAEPVAEERIRATAANHGISVRLFVVPEIRLGAMRQRVYGEPLPARYAPLLAEALGARQARLGMSPGAGAEARRGATAPSPSPSPSPSDAGSAYGGGVATPLEHFFELSAGLALNPPPHGDAEMEVEVEVEVEVESAAHPATAIPDLISEPVRLQVVSSASVAASAVAGAGDTAQVGGAGADTGGDSATDALCRRARNPEDKGGVLALRALRQRLTHPATVALLRELRASLASSPAGDAATSPADVVVAGTIHAIGALAELRDHSVIPLLIERLAAPVPRGISAAAHQALVTLCTQDFGRSRRRWETWMRAHVEQPRVEWLLEGLAHKNEVIRAGAAEELRHLAGDSFGFEHDGPKRERDRARRRFVNWWQEVSRPRRAP